MSERFALIIIQVAPAEIENGINGIILYCETIIVLVNGHGRVINLPELNVYPDIMKGIKVLILGTGR